MNIAVISRRRLVLWVMGVVLFGSVRLRGAVAAEVESAFRDGDRWSVVGDSITHSGSYHAWVYLYQLTRFPGRSLDVINCGIAGDTAAGGLRRLNWDILPTKPTVATVMFGMNDVGRGLYADAAPAAETLAKRREALDAYQKNLRSLVAALQQAGSRVVLVTPSPFDQTTERAVAKLVGVNEALAECAVFLRSLAGEMGATFVDFHGPMTRLTAELQATNPQFALTGADRIHPGAPGHLVMAYLFLKALHAPADVGRLVVDARALSILRVVNGAATDVRRLSARGIAFTWTENALPFPTDASWAEVLAWVPFTADLNQEVLQVTLLEPGTYDLRIDGERIRSFSAEELAHGVNLAELSRTPQYRQALEVLRLVKEHRLHEQETTRNIALVEHQCAPAENQPYTLASIQPHYDQRMTQLRPTQPPSSNLLRIYNLYPTIKPRQAEDDLELKRLAAAARSAAQPKPRKYEIERVGN